MFQWIARGCACVAQYPPGREQRCGSASSHLGLAMPLPRGRPAARCSAATARPLRPPALHPLRPAARAEQSSSKSAEVAQAIRCNSAPAGTGGGTDQTAQQSRPTGWITRLAHDRHTWVQQVVQRCWDQHPLALKHESQTMPARTKAHLVQQVVQREGAGGGGARVAESLGQTAHRVAATGGVRACGEEGGRGQGFTGQSKEPGFSGTKDARRAVWPCC